MGPIETYIRQSALARGIDPDRAVRVARAEGGLNDPVRQSEVMQPYGREESFGPFQLHMRGGLGAQAMKAGIDPRDPNQWQRGVDFALDNVKTGGWSPWMGAAKIGITGFDGVGGRGDVRAQQQPGEQTVTEYRNRPQHPAAVPGEVPPMPQPVYVGGQPVAPAPVDDAGRTQLAQAAAPAALAAPAKSGGVFDWLKGHLKTGEKGDGARKNLSEAMAGMAGKQQTVPQIVQPKAARVDDPTIATIDPQQALMQRQQMAEIMAKLNSGKLWG